MTDSLAVIVAEMRATLPSPGYRDRKSERIAGWADRLAALGEPVDDKGPWYVGKDGRDVFSDDFTVDAALRLSGDFRDDEHRKEYAEWLCCSLNKASTASQSCEAHERAIVDAEDIIHEVSKRAGAMAGLLRRIANYGVIGLPTYSAMQAVEHDEILALLPATEAANG